MELMLTPTQLFHGQYVIMSEESPQQEDPFGPLTIEPLLTSLTSSSTLGYLDDQTMGDRQPKVAADVQKVKKVGEDMGLTLNIGKCELFCLPNTTIADPLLFFTLHSLNEASLLGAPLFIGPELDDAWSTRLVDLRRAVERLSLFIGRPGCISSVPSLIQRSTSPTAHEMLTVNRSSSTLRV